MVILKKLKYILLCAVLLLTAAALIIYPERYVACCLDGWVMWAECVLPSLFPFMIITLVFIKTGIADKASLPLKKVTGMFRMPPAAAVCFVMSICSGYPAGAKAVSEMHANGCITADEANKLSCLCSTSGPLFIIGSVGYKMFGDKGAGWAILLCHALAVISVSLALSFFSGKAVTRTVARAEISKNVLYETFYSGVISVAVAGAYIAFFYVFGQIAADFDILYPIEKILCLFTDADTASAVCRGMIEVTAGCRALSVNKGAFSVPFAGFLITFGGISIIMQQLGFLSASGVKPLRFIGVKFLQATLCFLLLLPFAQ